MKMSYLGISLNNDNKQFARRLEEHCAVHRQEWKKKWYFYSDSLGSKIRVSILL